MSQSSMRTIVNLLLSSDITSARIAREAYISESIIRKLRLEYQTLDKTYFEAIEKLYLYAEEILKMKSFVSLKLNATTDYAAELEGINFYEFENITIKLEAKNNQTIELQFDEFDLDIFSDDKIKFNINVKNAMTDTEYSVDYLNRLNLNECKKAEIVFDNAGSESIKLGLYIDFINVKAEKIEDDDRAEFRKMMEQIAEENDEIFKGLVDK